MFIATKIATPDELFARDQQQLTIKIQTQHLLSKLDRRIMVAIKSHDRCLLSQLQAEREFLLKQ
jgi:hypothetical protein